MEPSTSEQKPEAEKSAIPNDETLQQMVQIQATRAMEKQVKIQIQIETLGRQLKFKESTLDATNAEQKKVKDLNDELKTAQKAQDVKFVQIQNQIDHIKEAKGAIEKQYKFGDILTETVNSQCSEMSKLYKNFTEASTTEIEKILQVSKNNEAMTKRLAELNIVYLEGLKKKQALQMKIERKAGRYSKILAEKDKTISDLRSRSEKLRQKLAERTESHKKKVEEKKKVAAEVKECQKKLDRRYKTYSEELATKENGVELQKQTLQDLKTKSAELRKKIESHQQKKTDLTNEVGNLTTEQEILRVNLSKIEKRAQEAQQEADNTAQRQRLQLSNMQMEADDVKNSLETLREKSKFTDGEIVGATDEIKNLRKTLTDKIQYRNALLESVDECKRKLDLTREENHKLEESSISLKLKLNQGEAKLQKDSEEHDVEKSKIETRINSLKKQLQDIQKESDTKLNASNQDCENFAANHHARMQALEETHLKVMKDLHAKHDEANLYLESCKTKKGELEQTYEKIEKLKMDLLEQYNVLKQQNANLNKKPVGILKTQKKSIVSALPTLPKNVTFKQTVSLASQSTDRSFDSLFPNFLTEDSDDTFGNVNPVEELRRTSPPERESGERKFLRNAENSAQK